MSVLVNPHPVRVIIRDSKDYSRVLFSSYYTIISGSAESSGRRLTYITMVRASMLRLQTFYCKDRTGIMALLTKFAIVWALTPGCS